METDPIGTAHSGYILACEVRGLVHGRHNSKAPTDGFVAHYILAKLADAELQPFLDAGASPGLADLPHTVGLATAIVASPLFVSDSETTRRIWLRAANIILSID